MFRITRARLLATTATANARLASGSPALLVPTSLS